jgi:hypothetical protein
VARAHAHGDRALEHHSVYKRTRWLRLGAAPGLYSLKALESKEWRDWEADSGVGDFGKEIRRRHGEEGNPDTRA